MTQQTIPELTLRSLRTAAVDIPMARPLGTSARMMRTAPFVLIDLETNEGITGRSYLFAYVAAALPAILAMLHEAFAIVRGDCAVPQDVADKLERYFRLIGVRGIVNMALAGLDIACWDALAVAAGVPLVALLGGAPNAIPAYNSNGLSLTTADEAADEAEKLVADGFRAVKLRLGYATLEQDVAVVRAVRRRLAHDVLVMSDYNQALTVSEAVRRGRALDGEGLAWIEEPIQHDDYPGYATVAREIRTPIQIGENFVGSNAMAVALSYGACDLVMLDVERIGGVTGWLRARSLAASAHVQLSSHLFPEISAHLLAATPTAHWLEYVDWAAPVLATPLAIANGHAVIPARPGIGLSWNPEAVARYRIG